MAKEFKDYDIKYKAYQATLLDGEEKPVPLACWPLMDLLRKDSHAEVRRVVYESGEDSENWQKFRVSLKGWSTAKKLCRLFRRWHYAEQFMYGERMHDEFKRINNYIDAMKRGGLLDLQGKVLK